MSHSLASIQSCFAAALLQGSNEDLLPMLDASASDSLQRRLQVYRNNFYYSLRAALADLYPVTEQLVGSEYFASTARSYVQQSPPTSAAISQYGEAFAEYLQRQSGCAHLPWLPDVARYELAHHRAALAQQKTAISAEQLQQLGIELLLESRLVLHPGLQMLASAWPVRSIWRAHQPGGGALKNIDLALPEYTLLLAGDGAVNSWLVQPPLFELIIALEAGEILGDALSGIIEAHPEFDVSAALAFVISAGLVVGYTEESA